MSQPNSPAPVSARLRTKRSVLTHWTLSAACGLTLAACSSGEGDLDDDAAGSGGAVTSSGGAASGGMASGGAASGGAASGGAASGGMASVGGTPGAGGTDEEGSGGDAMTGGDAGTGGSEEGSGGDAMTGGDSGTGGSESDTCEIGTTAGNEVLFIGESFVQASTIPEETTNLARAAGSLGASDSYVDVSVSGTWIGPGGPGKSIPQQYNDNSNGVRFVLMDGGGNDCWQGGQESHRTAALSAAEQLFTEMDANGVEKIVYFFYPDPVGGGFASLTACLDLLRPEMKALCEGLESPKCYWVDLRETWDGHAEYTGDGIHVAGPGNAPTAGAIFESMQENCVAP